jgi:hypothetical protein
MVERVKVNGSLDRFEGDYAIIYLDNGRKIDVPRTLISKRTRQGARLEVLLENGNVIGVETDYGATRAIDKRIKEKLEKLKQGKHLDNLKERSDRKVE